MVIATFKRDHDLFSRSTTVPLQRAAHPGSLRLLFTETHFVGYLTNTVIVGFAVVVITLATAVPRVRSRAWAGVGETLGIGIFLTYLVPPRSSSSPLAVRLLLRAPGIPLVPDLVYRPSRSLLHLALMGFFKTIPKDIEEQAMIDGLSRSGR